MINQTAKQSENLSDDMVESGNNISDGLKAGKPFKKKKNRPTK